MKNKVPLNILPFISDIKEESYINKHPLCDISSKLSVYIHFPFCMNSCLFCPIQTVRYDSLLVEVYIKSLKKEIESCFKMIGRHKVDNIHFGGGTPSLMREKEIEDILNIIGDYADIENAEILLEAHPKFISDSTIDYLSVRHGKRRGNTLSFIVCSVCHSFCGNPFRFTGKHSVVIGF